LKIGLTGGIGCGKSTVVRVFAEAGWRTIESDAVVRELFTRNASVRSALRERWGEAIFTKDGSVDRKAIAGRVFADDTELSWLEELLHPLVGAFWRAALAELPEANWLVEIPLLFEKRLETHFDLTVCVTCPPASVESRMVRRGYAGFEIEQRRKRQMPLDEKARRADCVISNAGSLDFLKQQTARLIAQV
jgi:dephospho-CoA kinase